MAGSTQKISGTFTDTTAGATYTQPRDGILVVDIQLLNGTATIPLEISLDGTNWETYKDPSDAELVKSFTTSDAVAHWEVLLLAGTRVRLNPSAASTTGVLYQYGRCGGV